MNFVTAAICPRADPYPARTGTFNFTIKAAVGSHTSTLTYQITVTVQGPPDRLVCRMRV